MTWHALEADTIRELLPRICLEEWGWTRGEVPSLAARFGWTPWTENSPNQLFYNIGIDYRSIVAIFSFQGNDVTHLFFTLGRNEGSTTPESIMSSEILFTDTHNIISETLDESPNWLPSENMEEEVEWVSGASTITLMGRVDMVGVRWELTDRIESAI
ncbi:DUF6301 family protein [Streptomyces sp. NBC_00264]|uniref:DUF6301 family protein n=1 Tax=unclassified Streptomyces TaxID=2593676 RepID=UPI0022549572|nr:MULTISPECIES: DUF6301 family protein [unclassified Streptomyces]MCX5161634.1 DUF6301 family protein [Streptomyces sp. NBC_00305]MCX5220157.1 DUF6301 family protein [Streptomyces sp. NBC_00264]